MTAPNPEYKQQAEAVGVAASQLMTRAGALWTAAAEQSDTSVGLGMDARINLLHNLVDLWVKGYANMVQAALARPGNRTMILPKPLPSQKIIVGEAGYKRTLTAGPFTRVGIATTVIPATCIKCEPAILDENATEFQVIVTDLNFVGANYVGEVTFTPADGAMMADGKAAQPETKAVTVGL